MSMHCLAPIGKGYMMRMLQHANCREAADPYVVESLVNAATAAMERFSADNATTPSDVISASFTLLDRTLRAVRNLQAPEDLASNTKEVARVLQDFLVDYGSLPN